MATMEKRVVGVIGGTGLYQIEGLEKVREVEVDTPFGRPSDAYVTGTLDGADFVFLPRHGKGHRLLPTELCTRHGKGLARNSSFGSPVRV